MRLIIGLAVGLLAGYLLTEAFNKRNEPEPRADMPVPPPMSPPAL